MFVDEVKVFAMAGHGGKGCVAFLRETFRPKGGPSGGNGGRGGDVILEADHDLNNLVAQFYQPRLIAERGEGGMGKGMDGKAGKDLLVKVPCGTLVWKVGGGVVSAAEGGDEEEGEEGEEGLGARKGRVPFAASASARPKMRYAGGARAAEFDLESEPAGPEHSGMGKGELVTDLTEHGQRFVLCRGGRGGLGNRNFATARRQAPRFAQPGEPGEEGDYRFELRLMADVGLVGYPNAGKSTLLTEISQARPKIAPYPFTTLHPQVGIVEYADWRRLVVCDVPGLVEGAHRDVGLGHSFLRHIQRCKVLVILLDMAGADGRNPWDDYRQLLVELELYDRGLLEKARLVVANKMDEPAAESNLRKFKRRVPKTMVLPISAAFGDGLDRFKLAIRETVGFSR